MPAAEQEAAAPAVSMVPLTGLREAPYRRHG
jgi:hypothetical protein